jgi:nucleoside-diphosphate-sugar epimerase
VSERVLITGACGRVGTAVLDHLADDYEFTPLDRNDHPEYDVFTADVSDYGAIRPAFDGQDAVVHLAANPSVSASWDSVLEDNIVGTYNVLEAASDAGVETVVFASSNHVVGMYEEEYAPGLYTGEVDLRLDHRSPVRPDSLYATSKLFGEAACRYYAEKDGRPTRCLALRIFSVRTPEYDHPYGDAEKGVHDGRWERDGERYRRAVARLKATWQSRRDLAQLVDCCLRSTEHGFDAFYGVSDNDNRWVDIGHARDVLGYRPIDSADEWESPPD